MKKTIDPTILDAVLPQTQCGLCNFDGCMPYATAMAEHSANINLCLPGGVKTMQILGTLLDKDPVPYMAEMELKTKAPAIAVIREAECIGCTKCIQACPVDAIMGSAKQMHTILTDICTGCELCIKPCPVDCIDMVAVESIPDPEMSRDRYHARNKRLEKSKLKKKEYVEDFEKKVELESESTPNLPENISQTILARKNYIADALARVKAKKAISKKSLYVTS